MYPALKIIGGRINVKKILSSKRNVNDTDDVKRFTIKEISIPRIIHNPLSWIMLMWSFLNTEPQVM